MSELTEIKVGWCGCTCLYLPAIKTTCFNAFNGIKVTSIKAEIINGFIEGGESKETICMMYNLHIDQVEDAILYFKRSA